MAKRKTEKTTVKSSTGPSQTDIGQLLIASLNINSNAILSVLLENSENLNLSQENLQTISNLIKVTTEKNRDATIQQLIKYY